MKRICFLMLALALAGPVTAGAQDAATEERLNKLSGRVDDLQAAQEALRRQIDALSRENASLREQLNNRPKVNYATVEDLKRVADAIKDVDRRRIEDAERVHDELLKIAEKLKAPPPPTRKTAPPRDETPPPEKSSGPEKGYEYVVQKGDTLSAIIQAYREKGIKVTQDQILKANPKLKPSRMYEGQKIWIPTPQ
jgi:Tfp pilus assembly protein FimV